MPDAGFADPAKLTAGFLAAAIKRGVKVYEKSAVKKITFTRKTATAYLDNGAITTTNLAICIGEPTSLFKPLKRHLRHEDRYAVLTEPLSAAVRAELGQRGTVLTDTESPAHHLWFTADHRALFAGADQKRPADRLRDKTLVQRTGQLMYELSRLYPAISGAAPAYGWDVPLAHPIDGVLYAGSHRNFPFHHFAFGTSHDPARAYLASRIILRNIQGRESRTSFPPSPETCLCQPATVTLEGEVAPGRATSQLLRPETSEYKLFLRVGRVLGRAEGSYTQALLNCTTHWRFVSPCSE